jgi:4'-phosphopantetheinyl transferase
MREKDKARSLAAGLLMRKYCGITDDSHLTYGKKGKPYLNNGLFFNISHSGDYVILGIAEEEIGVDIEQIRSHKKSLAEQCFTEIEREWLDKQESEEAFFILWTAKESIMKGSGLGFSLPPKSFSVRPDYPTPYLAGGEYWYLDWMTYDGYVICKACKGKKDKLELVQVLSGELLIK